MIMDTKTNYKKLFKDSNFKKELCTFLKNNLDFYIKFDSNLNMKFRVYLCNELIVDEEAF